MARTVDTDLLVAALVGYEETRKQIEARIAELRKRLGSASPLTFRTAAARPDKTTNRLSAAGRARIAAAQKKRWAAAKKAKAEPDAPKQADSNSQKPVKSSTRGTASKPSPKAPRTPAKEVAVKRSGSKPAKQAAPKQQTKTPAAKKTVVKPPARAKAAAKPVTSSQSAVKQPSAKPTNANGIDVKPSQTTNVPSAVNESVVSTD